MVKPALAEAEASDLCSTPKNGETLPVAAPVQTSPISGHVVDFYQKYFAEGQTLTAEGKQESALAENKKTFVQRHRRLLACFIPPICVNIAYWIYMAVADKFYIFTETSPSSTDGIPYWYMSVVLVFGSVIAGCTSEGGAAIAYPMMVLVFGIPPKIARDYSYMHQTFGMGCASTTIFFMKLKLEWYSLVLGSIGGVGGVILGLEQIVWRLTATYNKMYFVSLWITFAFSLMWINKLRKRVNFDNIPNFWGTRANTRAELPLYTRLFHTYWRAVVLVASGFLGGIFTAMCGSGIDIAVFAVLVLVFRVSEKIATPTSVILMALNAFVAFFYRQFGMGGVWPEAWNFLIACMPICVFGASFGALVGSHFHRLVHANLVYIVDATQFIGALIVLKPWTYEKTNTPLHLCLTSLSLIIAGCVFFTMQAYAGQKLLHVMGYPSAIDQDTTIEVVKGEVKDHGEFDPLVAKKDYSSTARVADIA